MAGSKSKKKGNKKGTCQLSAIHTQYLTDWFSYYTVASKEHPASESGPMSVAEAAAAVKAAEAATEAAKQHWTRLLKESTEADRARGHAEHEYSLRPTEETKEKLTRLTELWKAQRLLTQKASRDHADAKNQLRLMRGAHTRAKNRQPAAIANGGTTNGPSEAATSHPSPPLSALSELEDDVDNGEAQPQTSAGEGEHAVQDSVKAPSKGNKGELEANTNSLLPSTIDHGQKASDTSEVTSEQQSESSAPQAPDTKTSSSAKANPSRADNTEPSLAAPTTSKSGHKRQLSDEAETEDRQQPQKKKRKPRKKKDNKTEAQSKGKGKEKGTLSVVFPQLSAESCVATDDGVDAEEATRTQKDKGVKKPQDKLDGKPTASYAAEWVRNCKKSWGPGGIPKPTQGLTGFVLEHSSHIPEAATLSWEIALTALTSQKRFAKCRFHTITDKTTGPHFDNEDRLYGTPWCGVSLAMKEKNDANAAGAEATNSTTATKKGRRQVDEEEDDDEDDDEEEVRELDPMHCKCWAPNGWLRVKGRHVRALDCGCDAEEVLLDFWMFKTAELTSLSQLRIEGWNNDWVRPRQRALYLSSWRASTKLTVYDLYSMVSVNGRWVRRTPEDVTRIQISRLQISLGLEVTVTLPNWTPDPTPSSVSTLEFEQGSSGQSAKTVVKKAVKYVDVDEDDPMAAWAEE
ncbi:hypothetical protein VNI00_008976 [Paramarasmius palmivorus]|uniref:Uncharacterized protein n=1 Tax=Paramarasmius palmivorus TaxID=297713 RepID=A0AAW0CNZ5_9AGAR